VTTKHAESERSLRDIALVLFGLALSKSDRDFVLNSLQPGMLVAEVDGLIAAVRAKDAKPVHDWLACRGAAIERGKSAVQAMIEAIYADNEHQAVRRTIGELQYAVKIEDRTQLAERLRECAAKLDEIPQFTHDAVSHGEEG